MCIHTLVHPICRTCRRPITPPTPGTVVRIAYCPQAWDRLSASRRPWFSMSSPPPGSAFYPPSSPYHIPWPTLLSSPSFLSNMPPSLPPSTSSTPSPSPSDLGFPPPGHPKIGPTAHLACQYTSPSSSPSASSLPPPPFSPSSPPSAPSPLALALTPETLSSSPDPPFELSAPRLPSCHRCSPQSQPQSESRNYTWDSRDLCLEADEWMVYSQAQPERYARMCAWVYPPSSPHPSGGAPSIPSPEGRQSGDGDEDGNNRSGGDILRGYDWAIHGVPVPGSPWRAVPEFWRMKKPSFEKEKK